MAGYAAFAGWHYEDTPHAQGGLGGFAARLIAANLMVDLRFANPSMDGHDFSAARKFGHRSGDVIRR